jgi:hypothetical protein
MGQKDDVLSCTSGNGWRDEASGRWRGWRGHWATFRTVVKSTTAGGGSGGEEPQ